MKTPPISVYALTLCLVAFLLFSAQLTLAGTLLPLLGGAPIVWNTAMVFLQTMTLLGCAYAYALARFVCPGRQGFVHLGLFILSLFSLSFAIGSENAQGPAPGQNPLFWQFSAMTAAAGAPFFVLSASVPLLQHWFAATRHALAETPYFLYAANNAGTLLALVAAPFLFAHSGVQAAIWTGGYAALIAGIAVCALFLPGMPGGLAASGAMPSPIEGENGRTAWRRRALWLVLAFVPSSLMLSVTTILTTDIVSAPLLWSLPLALYAGSFILAFVPRPPVGYQWALYLQTFALAAVLCVVVSGYPPGQALALALQVALFAFTALVCHIKLAESRPGTHRLTEFYLILSLGMVLGGLFNTLVAPFLFKAPIEYNIALIAAVLLRFSFIKSLNPIRFINGFRKDGKPVSLSTWSFLFFMGVFPALLVFIGWKFDRADLSLFAGLFLVPVLLLVHHYRLLFALVAIVPLILYPGLIRPILKDVQFQERNSFGTLTIADSKENVRYMVQGSTVRGGQSRQATESKTPLAYLYPGSSAGDVFSLLAGGKGPQRVAVLGLGAGSVACYTHPGRLFDFYEMDPLVIRVAQDLHSFTFLSDCGRSYRIYQGAPRLGISRAPDFSYDMIFLDAFSTDSIPIHAITLEALEIYNRKLKPDGLLVINLSSRFLDLIHATAATSGAAGFKSLYKLSAGGAVQGTGLRYAGSLFGVFALDGSRIAVLESKGWKPSTVPPGHRPWTDSDADLLGARRAGRFRL